MKLKHGALNLTEAEVKYAILNSTCITDAARFLHISVSTFQRYAKMYFDPVTQKSYYELAKGSSGRRTLLSRNAQRIRAKDLLENKHPHFRPELAIDKLIDDGIFSDECCHCKYNKQRERDNKSPILLTFKNGDASDWNIDNLDLVCYNCYFLHYGDMKPKLRRLDSKIIKKISEIRIEERIKTKNVIKEPKQNDTKRVNLKNEFEIYLESLTDEEYKNIMGYERTTNQ
jgi:hypothetical protein